MSEEKKKKVMDPHTGNIVDEAGEPVPGFNPLSRLKNPDHIADLKADPRWKKDLIRHQVIKEEE